MSELEPDGEAVTLGILQELRETAEEISHGHMDYAARFHELLQKVANPNLPDVAQEMGFRVISLHHPSGHKRTVAFCSNMTVARAAWDCARKIFPEDRSILTWGGMIQYDSRPPRPGEE